MGGNVFFFKRFFRVVSFSRDFAVFFVRLFLFWSSSGIFAGEGVRIEFFKGRGKFFEVYRGDVIG